MVGMFELVRFGVAVGCTLGGLEFAFSGDMVV
jgi:hypothetical protein